VEVAFCDNTQRPMAEALRQGLQGFSEAYLASAFITGAGIDQLIDDLRSFARRSRHRLVVVTGDYLGFTSSQALEALSDLAHEVNSEARSQRVRVSVLQEETVGAFHPKVYLFMGSGRALLLVGSANLTSGGSGGNIEAYISASGSSQSDLFQAAKRAILAWAERGEAITSELTDEQKEAERRRRAEDDFIAVLRPLLHPAAHANIDDVIRLCAHNHNLAGHGPLPPTAERLLRCARAGRIVELHLSHSGLWLALPPAWFNADKRPRGDDKIGTATRIQYDVFGADVAQRLQKLQSRVEYGMRDFGWWVRHGVFVPDVLWPRCEQWFGEARAGYAAIADAALGPQRDRRRRAEEGMGKSLAITWRKYNRTGSPGATLERDVRSAISQRLNEIKGGRRTAWRFELSTLPHPVVGWAAMPPGVSGVQVSDSSVLDELATFGLSGLRWLASRLDECAGQGPDKCERAASELMVTNTIGSTRIAEASSDLADIAAARTRREVDTRTWTARRDELSAVGEALAEEAKGLSEAPSTTVMQWLAAQLGLPD